MNAPFCVASKGRAGAATTIDQLIREGAEVFVFVEPQEQAAYEDAYPGARLVVLPEGNKGIGYVRRFVLSYARLAHWDWFWMLDDDIKQMFHVEQGKCVKFPFRVVLDEAAGELSEVVGLAVGALEYQQYAWAQKKQFAMDSYCDVAVLINVAATRMIGYRDGVKEDRDFVLQALSLGYRTARACRWAFGAPKNGSNAGGLHEEYKAGLERQWSQRMIDLWPGVCEWNIKPDGRPDVKIHWRKLRGSS